MRKILIILELLILYVAMPLVYVVFFKGVSPIPFLLGAMVYGAVVLMFNKGFDRKELRRIPSRGEFHRMLRLFVLMAVLAVLFMLAVIPGELFSFPMQRPYIWIMVMLLYPLLSVYPQEILYRTLIFRRFDELGMNGNTAMHASAFAFALAHTGLYNITAFILSWLGGYIFSYTYKRTRSLPAVFLEHSLYGCWIFTLGMGYFFYHGNVQ
ncbi:CPBP family intramembrane glutamic endopeptidase [Limisalsivibrio acetivorans]|uniref:CPBP family intramembrane glutamic endopeptidase n=1 Tax=Limisalsivibrio acetivorans TaxID=1304888 RepID=UPI0003B38024|nr:CPBP family intramembrane glutamic endopeptidase [Limisalsivibrio acetivorans]